MRVREEDVASKLYLVFTYSSLEIKNIANGSPYGKGDHLVLEMDYTVKV